MAWNDLVANSEYYLSHVMRSSEDDEVRQVLREKLLPERYEPDINGSLKSLFPRDAEAMVLTNGIETVMLSSAATQAKTSTELDADWYKNSHASAAEANEWLFDRYAKIKASAPDRPVYHVHNHPAYTLAELNAPNASDHDKQFMQRLTLKEDKDADTIGSVPSRADIETWIDLRNLFTGAIYHQRQDVFAAYVEKPEVAKATHIVLEYQAPRPVPLSLGGGMTAPKHTIRLAPEGDYGDAEKGDVSIEFSEWEQAKDRYKDTLDFWEIKT